VNAKSLLLGVPKSLVFSSLPRWPLDSHIIVSAYQERLKAIVVVKMTLIRFLQILEALLDLFPVTLDRNIEPRDFARRL